MVGPYIARVRAVRVDPPLAALIVLGLLAVAGFGFGDAGLFRRLIAFWLLMGAVHLGIMVTAWRLGAAAAKSAHEPKATARLWRLVSLTGASLLAGDLIQLGTSIHDPSSPKAVTGTGPQLALLGVGMLGLLYGFLRFPLGTPEKGAVSRLRLDVATVMAGATTFGLWAFQLPPGEPGWGWAAELIFAMLLQPGLFLVAVFLVLKVVFSTGSPFTRAAGPLIVLSAVVTGILQSVPAAAYESEQHGPWVMAGNIIGSTLLAVGLRVQELQVRTNAVVRAPSRPYSSLPYGALVATWALAVMLLVASGLGWRTWAVSAGALVSTVLVVARQLAAFRHIAELLRERDVLTAKLTELAYHDGLTGLPNRALFMTRLTDSLATGPVTVFLIDLDEFKPVNDAHGHAAGDQLLVEVADRLRGLVRAGETPCRLGGDEFAVLIEGSAADRLPELVAALRGTVRIGSAVVLLRASVGVAQADGGSPDGLLHEADMAMYAMKQQRVLSRVP
jgi:diguanylate cyclase (GGDEF)-like protein